MKELHQTGKSRLILNKYLPQFLIVGVILLVYIQNLWFDFAYLDDNLIVFAEYEKIDSISKIPGAFLGGYLLDNYYRPMIMISFIIDTAIAGQSSLMYHLTNLIIHIIFTLLAFNLLLKFKASKNIALFLAIVFALHPINLNAVSWIAGRNDLLVGIFSLISILSFISYLENYKIRYFVIHLVAFFLAIFSKEIGIMVPVVSIIYLILFKKEAFTDRKKIILLLIIWGVISVLYLFLRFFVVKIQPQEQLGFQIFLNNFYILFEYFAKLFYLPGILPLSIKNINLVIIGVLISLILIVIVIWQELYKDKKFIFGILFFLIFIIPSLVVRLQTKDNGFVYLDCRMYLPVLGLLLSSSVLLPKINIHKRMKELLVTLLALYLTVFTLIKNEPYKNGELFWKEIIKDHPNAPYNYIGLGFYYYDNKEYEKAAEYAEKAIKINPTVDVEFYQKAALAYESEGDLISANNVLERSLKIDKTNPVTIGNLIKNYLKLKQTDQANKWAVKFQELDFKNEKTKAELTSSISYYFAQVNQYDYAIKLMKLALNILPDNSVFNNDLGVFYVNKGIPDSAKIYFEMAVAKDPYNVNFHNNLNFIKNQLNKMN